MPIATPAASARPVPNACANVDRPELTPGSSGLVTMFEMPWLARRPGSRGTRAGVVMDRAETPTRRASRRETEPAAAVAGLIHLRAGCHWLGQAWRRVRDDVAQRGALSPDDYELSIRMLGDNPDEPRESQESYAAGMASALSGMSAEFADLEPDSLPDLPGMPDPAKAIAVFVEVADGQIRKRVQALEAARAPAPVGRREAWAGAFGVAAGPRPRARLRRRPPAPGPGLGPPGAAAPGRWSPPRLRG